MIVGNGQVTKVSLCFSFDIALPFSWYSFFQFIGPPLELTNHNGFVQFSIVICPLSGSRSNIFMTNSTKRSIESTQTYFMSISQNRSLSLSFLFQFCHSSSFAGVWWIALFSSDEPPNCYDLTGLGSVLHSVGMVDNSPNLFCSDGIDRATILHHTVLFQWGSWMLLGMPPNVWVFR